MKKKFSSDLRILSLRLIVSLKKVDKIIIGVKSIDHVNWLSNNLNKIKKINKKDLDYILNLNKKNFFLKKKLTY